MRIKNNGREHAVITKAQVTETLRRMAGVVDGQNAGDPDYRAMEAGFNGKAFWVESDLVDRAVGAAQQLHGVRAARAAAGREGGGKS